MAGYKFNKNEDPTMKKLFSIAILFLCPFVIAEDDGPTIEGGVQMTVTGTEDINAAVGLESSASQTLGAIESGTLSGDTTMTVTGTEDINAAVGDKACADQQMGTIGKKATC
mgnify:CR=1 FL=1